MWVKLKMGQRAGEIVDMTYTDAKDALASGAVDIPTESEIQRAGHDVAVGARDIPPEQLIAGYQLKPNLGGRGFDLVDPGGVRLNPEDKPYDNYLSANEAMVEFARRARGLPPADGPDGKQQQGSGQQSGQQQGQRSGQQQGQQQGAEKDPDYDSMNVSDLDKLAADRRVDLAGATRKDDKIAALRRADKVEAAVKAGDYDALPKADLEKLAAERRLDVTHKSKAEIVEALRKSHPAR